MSADVAVEQAAASRTAEQYETLRTAVLGAGLPLEARSGLALFLRRGMWGWARAATLPGAPLPPTPSSPVPSTAEGPQRGVIHLFAAMAMRSTPRRDHERIAQSAIASPRA
jgi:hypothetical protein